MSWFSIPFPNPFKSHEFSDDEITTCASKQPLDDNDVAATYEDLRGGASGGGVKDDFLAIGETIGRQLRGVATFPAPPPTALPTTIFQPPESDSSSSSLTLAGIRSDLEEIGGSFKSSLSMLSSHSAVSEISKLASNFFQLNDDVKTSGKDDRGGSDVSRVWISDEVVEFVNGISMRPECWTDFPLSLNEDFSLSPAQSEHASLIEHLVPTLATLRANLNSDMSDQKFWMIYLILLIPRLEQNDLELLYTPKIIEARDTLLMMLKEKKDAKVDNSNKQQGNCMCRAETEGDSDGKTKAGSSEEKATLNESVNSLSEKEKRGKNTGKRLEVEDCDKGCNTDPWKQLNNEDEISFSDLEDVDGDVSDQQPGRVQNTGTSLLDSSTEWVQLRKNTDCDNARLIEHHFTSRDGDSEGELSDWLAVDEFD